LAAAPTYPLSQLIQLGTLRDSSEFFFKKWISQNIAAILKIQDDVLLRPCRAKCAFETD
jgi:hypothetical protein